MSENKWVHRDLKPQNIMLHFPSLFEWRSFKSNMEYESLVARAPIEKDVFTIKVIDFGFARELSIKMTSKKGTYYFMAP
jgi:serine/threonine protein kinase